MPQVTWAEALRGLPEFVENHQRIVVAEQPVARPPKRKRVTKRLLEVLALIDEPMTSAEIAGRMGGTVLKDSVRMYLGTLKRDGYVVDHSVRGREKVYARREDRE